MENTSLINSNPTNSPLSDNDMSLTHFSEWSRADKLAFSSLIVGIIGTISICLAFISIYYSHRSKKMTEDGLKMQANAGSEVS